MNYIQSLKERNSLLQEQRKSAVQMLITFRAFLQSDKFTGVDLDGSRKDWIATKDVDDRLIQILNALNTDPRVDQYGLTAEDVETVRRGDLQRIFGEGA